MSFRGRVANGIVVFDQPVSLPDGTPVRVEPMDKLLRVRWSFSLHHASPQTDHILVSSIRIAESNHAGDALGLRPEAAKYFLGGKIGIISRRNQHIDV